MMTQMNTRIDAELKRDGDAVFARIGLSPSEVVRAVWEYAVQHEEAPAVVASALSDDVTAAPSLEASFKTALAERSSSLVADFREHIGAPAPDRLDVINYRTLREEAWGEKLLERGLI